MMEREERIALFCDMVMCCHDLYLWEYDGEMNLLQSSCPEVKLINPLSGDYRSAFVFVD